MPTDAQRQMLINAVARIRAAEQALLQAGRASTDPVELGHLNMEYSQLDSFLSQMLHAQAVADDASFADAAIALKQQAASLQAQEAEMQAVVRDVALAAQIVGYIAQAAATIATL